MSHATKLYCVNRPLDYQCARAVSARAIDARNYAQKGCAMQFNGITLTTSSLLLRTQEGSIITSGFPRDIMPVAPGFKNGAKNKFVNTKKIKTLPVPKM